MNGGPIDASVGLAFSLRLFATYERSGLLRGVVHGFKGVRGNCNAYIELNKGQVVSCYLEDNKGSRYACTKAELCLLDEEKGPFEWSLQPWTAVPLKASSSSPQVSPPKQKAYVPHRLVAQLNEEQLRMYTSWQRNLLQTVFALVDGRHSIEEIATRAQLPTAKVEEALRVLVLLKAIMVH